MTMREVAEVKWALKRRLNLQGPLPSFFNMFSNEEPFDWISPLFDAESFRCGSTAIERQERAIKAWQPILAERRKRENAKRYAEKATQERKRKKLKEKLKAAGLIDRDPNRFYRGDFVVVDCVKGSPHFRLYGHLCVVYGPTDWHPDRYLVKVREGQTIIFANIWACELTLVLKVSREFGIR